MTETLLEYHKQEQEGSTNTHNLKLNDWLVLLLNHMILIWIFLFLQMRSIGHQIPTSMKAKLKERMVRLRQLLYRSLPLSL